MSVTKDADFTTVCPESFGETRCICHAGERSKCTIHSTRSKGKFEVSFIWRSESFGESRCIVSIWTRKTWSGVLCSDMLIRRIYEVFLEVIRIILINQARSDMAKQELHIESLNKCIGELQRQTEEQRLKLQDAQYGFVESTRNVWPHVYQRKSSQKYSNPKYARKGRN